MVDDSVSFQKALIEIDRACPSGTVIQDPDVLLRYASDASECEPTPPDAVVRPNSTSQVAAVLKAATKHGIPVTPRGAGTSRVGGAVPVNGGIVMSLEKMNAFEGLETRDRLAVVQPGCITGQLKEKANDEGLLYPVDPNSYETCTIGGNIGANAGGPGTYRYGVTRDFVLGLEAVTGSGEIISVGRRTKKGVTGYDLVSLLTGSEGTLAVVTQATMRLIPQRRVEATLLAFLPQQQDVAVAIRTLSEHGVAMRCAELLDSVALSLLEHSSGFTIPNGSSAALLIDIEESKQDVLSLCSGIFDDLNALDVLVARSGADRERIWSGRRQLSYTIRKKAKHKLSEDVVVPQSRLADLIRCCHELSETHRITMPTYGHAGDGNLHVNFLWNDADERQRVDAGIEDLFRAVIHMKGSLSGEHGIGAMKAPFLTLEQSPAVITLQKQIKSVFDPAGILNPGKIFQGVPRHGYC